MSSHQAGMDNTGHIQTYKKRRDSTLAEKVKILELLQQPKASQSSVARNMGLSQSTISRVMKKRDEILERWNHNENPSRKRNRPFKHAKVDEALLEWLLFAKANKLPISGPILMRQAEAIANEIGCPQFKPSNGWLWRWKERYRLFYRAEVLPGEKRHDGQSKCVKILPKASQIVRMELTDSKTNERFADCHLTTNRWVQRERSANVFSEHIDLATQGDPLSRSVLLARLAKDYHLEDIFCAVGSPFHFRIMARPGMVTESKEMVNIWFCCNMNGTEKMKLLVTHNILPKSWGTHCLPPVSLKASDKGEFTDSLLIDWLLNWDAKLGRQERKVLLVFTAHNAGPKVKLRNISLCIFAKEQAPSKHLFGQELISEFSMLYRQLLLERLQEDTNMSKRSEISLLQKMQEISLTEASYTMNKAWLRVTPHTIKSCFQKQEGIRVLCSAKLKLSEARPYEDMSHPNFQERNSNVANYTSLSGQASYRTITIKEENVDIDQENNETSSIELPCLNQRIKVEDQAELSNVESHPQQETSAAIIKSEDPIRCINVQEIRQACGVIQHFLSSENQDMSIFCELQSQVERCLTSPNIKKPCSYVLRQ